MLVQLSTLASLVSASRLTGRIRLDSALTARPHTSVSDASLYKHIDPDLPESQRIRQLLIWVASRAMEPSSSSGRKGRKSTTQLNQNLPPLPPGGDEILKEVQEDILRQLAEKRIDTSAFSEPANASGTWSLKENEQNVKNRAREKLFTEQIEEYVLSLCPNCHYIPLTWMFRTGGRRKMLPGRRLLNFTMRTKRMCSHLSTNAIEPGLQQMAKQKGSKERPRKSRRTWNPGRTSYRMSSVDRKATMSPSISSALGLMV